MNKICNKYQILQQKIKNSKSLSNIIQIRVGSATCENASGAVEVMDEFKKNIEVYGNTNIQLIPVGCTGRCSCEPIISILIPGEKIVIYQKVNRELAHKIFISHIKEKQIIFDSLLESATNCDNDIFSSSSKKNILSEFAITKEFFEFYGKINFFSSQNRIALRNAGIINPESFDDYILHQGFLGLSIILDYKDPDLVIQKIYDSNLRGRGGGGFLTGLKWKLARESKDETKYVICNADEGDPGAFMDRSILESDPFSVIEGMIIAGYAIGAKKGFFYIRAEYPLAIERVQKAINICTEKNFLGKNILNSGFNFDLEVRLGAGAFVCGEETALIRSIEGERGQPKIRPPYPVTRGLWNKPTVINNVETLTNIPAIIVMGVDNFKKIGTTVSGGTKVFALAGKINHTGLVEVPMGTTLRDVVFKIGGGVPKNKKLKAVQTGGPSGGLIPYDYIDTPIDYNTLSDVGSIMGSGGMIILDEDDCVVDVAKFFLEFTQDESCGKCSPCREGTLRMLEILEKITSGNGVIEDINNLERLANVVKKASLCGLGKAAPNPVISTLHYFRNEYLLHVIEKRCSAKKCTALVHYEIDDKCIGCMACSMKCPVGCIAGIRREKHFIDQSKCIKCGACFNTCKFNAINKI